jgi:hypothetical protein
MVSKDFAEVFGLKPESSQAYVTSVLADKSPGA